MQDKNGRFHLPTMILHNSTVTIGNQNQASKPFVEVNRTSRRTQQVHQHSRHRVPTIELRLHYTFKIIVTTMYLTRCCHGDFSGTLQLKGYHRYISAISSWGKAVASEQLPSRQGRMSENNEFTRPYCTINHDNSLAKHTIAFIPSSPQYHFNQQQSYASTQTKPPRSANRWKSPILRPPEASAGSKRPPKLFKRLHNIRGKKNSDDDDQLSTMLDDGKLYRADRVLANRTGKSRKECFQLLQDRRVFMVTDQLYNEISSKQKKDTAKNKSVPMLSHISSATDIAVHNVDGTRNDENEKNDNKESKSIVQQYRLEVVTGPAIKIGMHTKLRIDKYQDVPLPPPLLMIYHKPKVRSKTICVASISFTNVNICSYIKNSYFLFPVGIISTSGSNWTSVFK